MPRGAALVAALSLAAARVSSATAATGLCRVGGGPGCAAEGEEGSLVQLRKAAREPAYPRQPLERLDPKGKGKGVACPGDEPEECHLDGAGEGCEVHHMRAGRVYDVYPGGLTACLDSTQPYYFSVIKGSAAKLMLMFDDGGACYTPEQLQAGGFCATTPYLMPWSGLLNRTDTRNPFRHYTIVRVRYCSGDGHMGNTSQPWGLNGGDVPIRGAVNADAAVDWAVKMFNSPALKHLVIGGYSAGAIGVQAAAEAIIRRFGERESLDIDVFADSFAGVYVPSEATEPAVQLFRNYLFTVHGTCNNMDLMEGARQKCLAGTLRGIDYFRDTIERREKVSFAMINTKRDADQLRYSNWQNLDPAPTAAMFYKELTLVLKYFAGLPNFHSYLIDSDFHTFLRQDEVFTATPTGITGGDGQKLLDWITAFADCALAHHDAPASVCTGREVTVTHEGEVPEPADYCDPALVGTATAAK